MFRFISHARAIYTGVAAPGTVYRIRIPVSVGDKVRRFRVWVTVYGRAANTVITVDINHSDELNAKDYAPHTVGVVNDSTAATGKLTGEANLTANGPLGGMLGSYVEIVLTITGANSSADLQVAVEGNAF